MGNLCVAMALGNKLEDLALTIGKFREHLLWYLWFLAQHDVEILCAPALGVDCITRGIHHGPLFILNRHVQLGCFLMRLSEVAFMEGDGKITVLVGYGVAQRIVVPRITDRKSVV